MSARPKRLVVPKIGGGGGVLISLESATQWVPCPSRSLRRAGVGNAGALQIQRLDDATRARLITKRDYRRGFASNPDQSAQIPCGPGVGLYAISSLRRDAL